MPTFSITSHAALSIDLDFAKTIAGAILIDKSLLLVCLIVVRLSSDRTEIESWYRQHGAALLLFGLAIVGDSTRAQDALHQVFLRLLEHPRRDHIGDVPAYLFKSLRNAILNDVRNRARVVALDPYATPWFDVPHRDHLAEKNLRLALAALPEDQRQILVLHIWGTLTFSQAAEVLDISVNTAAYRYRYAITKLRESMSIKEGLDVRSMG